MTQSKKISFSISKSQQGEYLNLPFEVPNDVETITVKYIYDKTNAIIDLGLSDNRGKFLGWSGSDRSEVSVGEAQSSRGYLTTELESGEFNIIIGAYKVPNEGIDVEYEIIFHIKHLRWFKGDLHVHSTASDGIYGHQELLEKAREQGLDFLAVCDHNNFSLNYSLPSEEVTFIPSVEWTHYKGHVNFFGIVKPFENSFVANNDEQAGIILDYARDNGAIVSINHPFDFAVPYKFDMSNEKYFEVWNGFAKFDTIKAINYFDSLLKQGKRPICLGGSDYHRDDNKALLGTPTVYVRAKSKSVKDLLSAIRQGNVYISDSPNGAVISVNCQGATIGDSVKLGNDVCSVDIEVNGAKEDMFLLIYNQDGIVDKKDINNLGGATLSVSVSQKGYLRFAVGKKMGLVDMYPSLITNAIYFE